MVGRSYEPARLTAGSAAVPIVLPCRRLAKPGLVGLAAGVLALGAILVAWLAPSGPVLPTLQDRNVLVRVQGAPGTSLTEMNRVTSAVAGEMRAAPGNRVCRSARRPRDHLR